jgi:hypothetical protein
MLIIETFRARGHPNVRPSHRTTVMVTKEADLTPRGNCIMAVRAEKGLRDLDPRLKDAMRRSDARIQLVLEIGGLEFEVTGEGDPGLTLSHPTDIVARKSHYICDRTLMIRADKAACNADKDLVNLLKDENRGVNVTISVDLCHRKQ